MTPNINIIDLAEKHGQTSYRNRADTKHPAYGFTEEGLQAFAHALLAAAQAVQPAVPCGWKLSPIDPTREMRSAGRLAIHTNRDSSSAGQAICVFDAMLAAAPAHPAEGVPAQAASEIDERAAFDDFFRKRNRLHPDTDTTFRSDAAEPWKYWKARAAIAATQLAAQGMEAPMVNMTPPATSRDRWMYEQGRLAEREIICAAIKSEDDHCVDQGDYMLDSDDCIKIVRGEWERPDFSGNAAQAKQGGA